MGESCNSWPANVSSSDYRSNQIVTILSADCVMSGAALAKQRRLVILVHLLSVGRLIPRVFVLVVWWASAESPWCFVKGKVKEPEDNKGIDND